jgi:HEAT repeat protein
VAKQSKQSALSLLKLALLGLSFPIAITSFSPTHANPKPNNSWEYAQVIDQPTPQPNTSAESEKTNQLTEDKTEVKSENNQEKKQQWWLLSIPMLAILYLGTLRFRPLWLLWLPAELSIPQTPINPPIKIPVGLLRFLKYHPRVLDAWVEKHLETFQNNFLKEETVEERKDYVTVPVILNDQELDEITPENLSETFKNDKRIRVLIKGEGGSGKTTIACEIAKWAMEKNSELAGHSMLPILIEKDLESNAEENTTPLTKAVVNLLQELTDREQKFTDELLVEQLLRQRRILLIVDRYSEMSQQTCEQIKFIDTDFPANALIVTSRNDDKNFKGIDIKIETCRFDGGKLAYFIEQYLKKREKWNLFEEDQEDFLQECSQLTRIVGERKTITVLLAKLYAERMINENERTEANDNYSVSKLDNIPDLILDYLQKLNDQVEAPIRNDFSMVKEDAKIIAWKCLEKSYKPSQANREDVVTALGNNAESCLEYFDKYLRLIKLVGYEKDRKDRCIIRFALDPVAEYLAALYLVQNNLKDDPEKWNEFLATAQKKSDQKEEIKGFLLAVRDCCLAKGSEMRVPNFVADEMGKLAGLDLDALEQQRERRRIKRLIRNLFAPEATVRDRLDDLRKIGESGSVAKFAARDLLIVLTDENKEVRWAAAWALGKLGDTSQAMIQGLLARLQHENWSIRQVAAWPLGELGNSYPAVIQELLACLQDENWNVRWVAAEALGKLGDSSPAVIEELFARLQDENEEVRRAVAGALGKLGDSSPAVIQGLLACLQHENEGVRSTAAGALGELGDSSPAVIQGLLACLQHENEYVRWTAAWALGELGDSSPPVIQQLVACLQDEYWSVVSVVAAEALGKLGDSSPPVIQGLLARLKDENEGVRMAAAWALGNLGDSSPAVIQGLLARIQDEDCRVRKAAKEALTKLGHSPD